MDLKSEVWSGPNWSEEGFDVFEFEVGRENWTIRYRESDDLMARIAVCIRWMKCHRDKWMETCEQSGTPVYPLFL